MGSCWPTPIDSHPIGLINPGDKTESKKATKSSPASEVPPDGKIITPNLKMFTLAELKSATSNFRPDTVVGEGGFRRVFKGYVDEKTYAPSVAGVGLAVAVKKSEPDSIR